MSNNIRDMAIAFEGRKVGINQNKDGIILRLSIHPSECPPEVWKDWVGTRYQVALVQIGDDEQPTANDSTIIANNAIKSAGMLCRERTFQQWLQDNGYFSEDGSFNVTPEDTAVSALRRVLGIKSRTEMRTNKEALDKFLDLRQRYQNSFDGT